jgi:hypothetical protein
LVTWQSVSVAGDFKVLGQRYSASGQMIEVGSEFEFVVSGSTPGLSATPSVTALADGGWVVSWMALNAEGDKYGVYARHYSSTGAAGGEIRIAADATHDQWWPSVSALGSDWLVSWTEQGTAGFDVHVRRFTSVGLVDTAWDDLVLQTNTTDVALAPSVAAMDSGVSPGWLVSWESVPASGGGRNIHAQKFDTTGVKVGSEVLIHSTTTAPQLHTAVTVLLDGGWLLTWQSTGADSSGLGISGQRFSAAGTPIGSEFHINTYGVAEQSRPEVSGLVDGGWVVSWQSLAQDGSGLGIYAQRFDQSGTPLTQGATLSITGDTSAQLLHGGAGNDTLAGAGGNDTLGGGEGIDTAVYSGVQGGYTLSQGASGALQLVKPDGVVLLTGIETLKFADATVQLGFAAASSEFRVNTYTNASQEEVATAALPDGGWVATWQSDFQDSWGKGIYAQRYSAAGQAVGDEFRVNSMRARDQASPSIATLSDGGWVVTWQSDNQVIYAQRYGSNGSASGSELTVSAAVHQQSDSDVTALADGGWLVAWMSWESTEMHVHLRRYSSLGVAGDELSVDGPSAPTQMYPSVAALSAGGWVLSWGQYGAQAEGIFAVVQHYAADGTLVSRAELGTDSVKTNLTALPDQGWLLTWEVRDFYNYVVHGQRFTASGAATGHEFVIPMVTGGVSPYPAVTVLADGGWLITWNATDVDGSETGIAGQRYSAQGAPVGEPFQAIRPRAITNSCRQWRL